MSDADFRVLRTRVERGTVVPVVAPLRADELGLIAWSGSPTHLKNVAGKLDRVALGEVEYLVVRADGLAVVKGGIDFAKEANAGTISQVATHPRLKGLGLATLLIHELEERALHRGVRRLRLDVETSNDRARCLYARLGYVPIGESEATWDAEADDGSPFAYTAQLTEMLKEV